MTFEDNHFSRSRSLTGQCRSRGWICSRLISLSIAKRAGLFPRSPFARYVSAVSTRLTGTNIARFCCSISSHIDRHLNSISTRAGITFMFRSQSRSMDLSAIKSLPPVKQSSSQRRAAGCISMGLNARFVSRRSIRGGLAIRNEIPEASHHRRVRKFLLHCGSASLVQRRTARCLG